MQQVHDHVAGRRDHVHVPGHRVRVDRNRAPRMAIERGGRTDVLHRLERRVGNVAAKGLVPAGHVRAVVQHGHAIADQLDMAQFLGRDRSDQAIERAKLAFAAEIEALEHVVAQRGHLAILAAKQLLQGGAGVRILSLGGRKFDLQLIDTQEHLGSPGVRDALEKPELRQSVPPFRQQ